MEEESGIWDPVSLSLSAVSQLWDLGPWLPFTPANEEPAASECSVLSSFIPYTCLLQSNAFFVVVFFHPTFSTPPALFPIFLETAVELVSSF